MDFTATVNRPRGGVGMASVVSHTVRRLILPRHPLAMATKCSVMLCLTAMLVSALAWWSVLSSFGSHRVRATREWPRIQIALAAGQHPGKPARCSVVVLARGEFPGVLCKTETAGKTVNPSGTSSARRTPQESAQIRIGDSSAHRMAQDNSQTPSLNGSPQHGGLQGAKFEKSAVTATITSFVKQNDDTGANPPKSGADRRYQDGISRTSPGPVAGRLAGRRNPSRPTVAMWKIAEAAMEKLARSDDLLKMGHNKTLTFAEQMRFNGLLRLRNRVSVAIETIGRPAMSRSVGFCKFSFSSLVQHWCLLDHEELLQVTPLVYCYYSAGN